MYEKWMVNECAGKKTKMSTTKTKVPDPEDSDESDDEVIKNPGEK